MIRNSIITKISVIFLFSLLLLVMFFNLLFEHQREQSMESIKERQLQSVNYLLVMYRNGVQPADIEEYFNNFGLKKVTNEYLRESVLKQGEVIYQKLSSLTRFSSIAYNEHYYLYIDNPQENVLLESQESTSFNDGLWVVFVIALIIFGYMYLSIFQSMRPLKHLSEHIRKFASGDMNITCKSTQSDEIAEVANEFDRAVQKIRDLTQARQLFLRTIMHELKTPIGKGRIVTEMLEDETAKKRLKGVFSRLDLLISEFSKIEQLASNHYALNLNEYSLVHILDQAVDLLMLDEKKQAQSLSVEGEFDLCIEADFELLALAIKNLLDNAIKHSPNHRARVFMQGTLLRVSNEGDALEMSIDQYFQPFVSGSKTQGSGLGLGLYIVKHIIERHGFSLLYAYEKGEHRLSIDLRKGVKQCERA